MVIKNLVASIKRTALRKIEDLVIQLQNSKFIEKLDLFLNRIYGVSVSTLSLSMFPLISLFLYSNKKLYFGGAMIHSWDRLKFYRHYEKNQRLVEEFIEFFWVTDQAFYNYNSSGDKFMDCQKHNMKVLVEMILAYICLIPQIMKLYRTNKLVYVNFVLQDKPTDFKKFLSNVKI